MDEKFEVIPALAPVKPAEEQQPAPEGPKAPQDVSDDYTEDDVMFISESLTALPCIFFPKIPVRTKEQLRPFNHQFYVYCKKKGINPFEFFFDEFGLVISGLGVAGGIWRDYKEQYGSSTGKEQKKEDRKLSADYEHEKQVAEQKQKDIQGGVIT